MATEAEGDSRHIKRERQSSKEGPDVVSLWVFLPCSCPMQVRSRWMSSMGRSMRMCLVDLGSVLLQ